MAGNPFANGLPSSLGGVPLEISISLHHGDGMQLPGGSGRGTRESSTKPGKKEVLALHPSLACRPAAPRLTYAPCTHSLEPIDLRSLRRLRLSPRSGMDAAVCVPRSS
jgi:hypothetical protein